MIDKENATPKPITNSTNLDEHVTVSKRHIVDQLPAVNQTELLKKFFANSGDALFQPENSESLSGFIGKIPPYADLTKDFYINEPTAERQIYQLEPTMLSRNADTDEVEQTLFYEDLVNLLRFQGGLVENHDRMFNTESYAWAPPIDYDKFLNFQNYFWIPDDSGTIEGGFTSTTPDYILMETGALDGNPWSARNQWVHLDDLTLAEKAVAIKAIRPIIEFIKDLELYNYGNSRRDNVTVRDHVNEEPGNDIAGSAAPVIIDGITLEDGDTILFTNPNIATIGSWDLEGFDLENDPNGAWDNFTGATFSSPLGDITLKIDGGNGNGIIDSATIADFTALSFIAGMSITMQGSDDDDGIYTIAAVVGSAIVLTTPFGIIGDTLQPNNVTILENPVNYKNKVFEINNIGVSATLTLVADGANANGAPNDGEIILVLEGTIYGSLEYFWQDATDSWIEAQPKEFRNTAPLFQLYDNDKVQLQDPGIYPNSNFVGSKIFTYKINTDSDQIDVALDRPLSYDEYGEIVFENNMVTDIVTFNLPAEEIPGYFYHKTNSAIVGEEQYNNDWYLKANISQQFLIEDFLTVENQTEYVLAVVPQDIAVVTVIHNTDVIPQSEYTLMDNKIILDDPITPNNLLRVRYYSEDVPPIGSPAVYEIPINLQANPNNLEIDYTSKSDFFKHFTEIVANQPGLNGNPNGLNNYRDLPEIDFSLGDEVLQHQSPLLKLMAVGTSTNTDYMYSVRYVEREFSRFRNKFMKKIETFINSVSYNEPANMNATFWMESAVAEINLGKTDSFPFAHSGMGVMSNGEPSYIPPSPSRLGVYPVYKPEKYLDTTYAVPTTVIQMHDGSIVIAYNDFRDEVILELENNIYDNIPEEYRNAFRPDFDYINYVDSEYRSGDYSTAEFNLLLTPIIQRWASSHSIDIEANDVYDPNDPFTWNYSGTTGLAGYWRGIYKNIYDTDRPNTHPWEMFGFSAIPDWWDARYGTRPYKSNNPILWTDMENGYIAGGPREGIDAKYARPGAAIPVDINGFVLDPIQLGVSLIPGAKAAQANWAVGDEGPAETVFRRSEFWDFAVAQISYLMKPAQFFETAWDSKDQVFKYEDGNNPQWLRESFGLRPNTTQEVVHGETVDGTVFQSNGVQQWISDWVVSNGQSVTLNFGNLIRQIDVNLGHKLAGFIDVANTTVLADNLSGPIPTEDVNVLLYKNPSIREEFYGGVIVEKIEGTGWAVYGYDLLNGNFYTYPGIVTGKKDKITAGAYTVSECTEFNRKKVVAVPYGTVFTTYQDVYNFLISYGEFLSSRGWIFDDYDNEVNDIRNWRLSGKQFLFWAQGDWAAGSVITVSPSSEKLKFATEHGEIQSLEQIINGVYSLLNRDGRIIQPRDTFVNRCGDEILVMPEEPETIYAARLFIAENEHVMLFNNTTIFNDLMYDPLYNLRQPRLRLFTTRSLGWNGRLDTPGYIVTDNTLTPNYEKSVNDFTKFYGIEDQVNSVAQKQAARNMINFQPRDYMSTLLISPLTQFQFYQGFIKQKGTESVFNRLLRSDIATGSDDVNFFEEWAFRLGNYGATSNFSTAELKLISDQLRGNPQLIEFTSSKLRDDFLIGDSVIVVYDSSQFPAEGIVTINDELIQYSINLSNQLSGLTRGVKGTEEADHLKDDAVGVYDNLYDDVVVVNPDDDRWVIKPPNDGVAIFRLRDNTEATRNQNAAYFFRTDNKVAGYVEDREVKFRVSTIDERNTLVSDILTGDDEDNTIEFGNQIWVDNISNFYTDPDPRADAFNYGFQVFTIIESAETFGSPVITELATNPGDPITVNVTGTWAVGGYLTISGFEGTEPTLNGVHEIISLDGGLPVINVDISDDSLLTGTGILYEFADARFIDITARNDAQVAGKFADMVSQYVYVDTRTMIADDFDTWEVYQTINAGLSWTTIRTQTAKTHSRSFKESLLYNKETNIIDSRMHIFDPAKGLYPGQSLSEITYKIEYDPAKYTHGDDTRFQIDPDQMWGELQVGQVWWDLRQVEYENYEIGTNRERRNKWGRLAPGKSIDVYEWIRSSVPPSQWASSVREASDQPEENFRYKPSGDAYFGEDSGGPYVEQRVMNQQTGSLEVRYYFWVINSTTVPNIPDRDKSVSRIAREMTNPTAGGLSWFAPINESAIVVANVSPFLTPDDSILQLNYNFELNQNNIHREWLLIKEGAASDTPSTQLWDKMVDSLTGIDSQNNIVPDPSLEESRKYGNSIRPRQGWFIDNDKAAHILFTKVNELIYNTCLVDKDGVLDSLSVKSSEPTPYGSQLELERLITLCEFNDPDDLEIDSDPGTMSIFHVADNDERNNLLITGQAVFGQQIWVDGTPETGGFWVVYQIVDETPLEIDDGFELTCSEAFKLEDFWNVIDFYEEGISEDTVPDYTVETIVDRDTTLTVEVGDIVLVTDVNSDGTDVWALYRWDDVDGFESWSLIGKEGCAIQFNVDLFFDITYGNNDVLNVSSDYPNGVPGYIQAMQAALAALQDTMLTDLEENTVFFSMINYVHTEQLIIDWVFKTTYISSLGLNRNVGQDPILVQDRTDNFISFIEEAKPYHTKLREFRTQENFGIDVMNANVTDFDKPVYWDDVLEEWRVLDPADPTDQEILADTDNVHHDWYENYIDNPELIRSVTTTIVFDRVSCDVGGGWDPVFGWDNEANSFWDMDIPETLTAADRITQYYNPQPLLQSDITEANVGAASDIASLINGCDFKATIIDGGQHGDLMQETIGGWGAAESPWELIPWGPMGGASNVIDISEYDAIYDGGPSQFKTMTQAFGDGIETVFPINGYVAGDEVAVFSDGNVVDPSEYNVGAVSVVFNNPPADGALIQIGLYAPTTFEEAPVTSLSDILVDGNLFKQPHLDNNHPEELIIAAMGEAISIKVDSSAIPNGDPSGYGPADPNGFRLFLNNVNARNVDDTLTVLETTLVDDIDDTQTEIELTDTTGFNGGELMILSHPTAALPNHEVIYVRGPDTTDKLYSAYNAVADTIDLAQPLSNSLQVGVGVRDTIDGSETPLVEGVDYTVNVGAGTLTFINPPTPSQYTKVVVSYKQGNILYDVIRGFNESIAVAALASDALVIFDDAASQDNTGVWDTFRTVASDTTTLADPLNLGDTTIELASIAGLPKQLASDDRMVTPGVIWVGTERIEFYRREATTLMQIVRGTQGTSIGIPDVYDTSGRLIQDYKGAYVYYLGGDITLSNNGLNGEITSATDDFTTYGLVIGQTIHLFNEVSMENNGVYTINAISPTTLTLDEMFTGPVGVQGDEVRISMPIPGTLTMPAGTTVFNGSKKHEIPEGYEWFASPETLQNNDTETIAKFINGIL